jgi:hypothetical protein
MQDKIIFKLDLVFSFQVLSFLSETFTLGGFDTVFAFVSLNVDGKDQITCQNIASGSPASKTLSWHLVSETKSTLKGTLHAMTRLPYKNSFLGFQPCLPRTFLFASLLLNMTLRRFTCAYHPVMKMQKLLENLLQFFNSWVCIEAECCNSKSV